MERLGPVKADAAGPEGSMGASGLESKVRPGKQVGLGQLRSERSGAGDEVWRLWRGRGWSSVWRGGDRMAGRGPDGAGVLVRQSRLGGVPSGGSGWAKRSGEFWSGCAASGPFWFGS